MKRFILCLIAMFAIITFTHQSAIAVVNPLTVSSGAATFTSNLGTMIFENFDGALPTTPLIEIRPTAAALPSAILLAGPNVFLWEKLSTNPPTPTPGMNNFELNFNHITGNMTVTLTNLLKGTKSVTYTNWAAAITGPRLPGDINAINIHMKTANDANNYTLILLDLKINTVQTVPNVANVLSVPDGSGGYDKTWNITGITPDVTGNFKLTGTLKLPNSAYVNDPSIQVQFDFGNTTPVGPFGEGPILWFDPMRIGNTDDLGTIPPLPPLPADGELVSKWMNQGNPLATVSADAPQPIPFRDPMFKLNAFPTPWPGVDPDDQTTLGGWPGLLFTEGPGCCGPSSILAFAYSPLVTSDWTSSPLIPQDDSDFLPQQGKNLFIAFSTTDLNSPVPQVLFEAGGALSGFNAYIQNGYLIMGIWSRLESIFFTPDEPLSAGTHIANLEFQYSARAVNDDGSLVPGINRVRMLLDGVASPWRDFHGLQKDISPSAIGAEMDGTMFAPRLGAYCTLGAFYTGLLGDIKLYGDMTPDAIQGEYNYYNERYGTATVIVPNPDDAPKSAWQVYSDTKLNNVNANVAEVFPNPFSNTATLSLNVTESQRVRIDIFDMTGVNVLSIYDGMASKGLNNFMLNGSSLSTGVYAVRISGDNFTTMEKVVLTK